MKITKQLAAFVLALFMVISTPLAAFAEGEEVFTLTTVQTKFYAGMSYDVTATITNATAAEANGNDRFDWSVSASAGNASVATLDNYKATQNDNGTYTVTETATVTMPQAGAVATITATFASRSKSLSLTALQPIESFDVDFVNTDHAYLDTSGTVNVLYVDRNEKDSTDIAANFTVKNINPSVNDDEIFTAIGGFTKSTYTLMEGANDYSLTFTEKATGRGTMNFSVLSGGKSFKNYEVQVCIPATDYNLDIKNYGTTSFVNYGNASEEGPFTITNLYTGKAFSIRASGSNIGNDEIKYELYTDEELKTKAPDSYCTKTNTKECELKIAEQGTYWLVSKNYSIDNGKLKRDIPQIITRLVVNQSVYADSIKLFELDEEGVKTDKALEDITLYTNTKTTYDLNPNITITPENTTDNLVYTSSNTAVATVVNGVITAKAKGDAVIYIKSDENVSANVALNVHVRIGVKAITSIVKQDKSSYIPSGHVQKLVITTNPTVIDEPVYWSSSNRDVLSVDRLTGVITANEVTENTNVTITAVPETDSAKKQTIDLTVVPANRAESLTLTATSSSDTYKEEEGTEYKSYSDYYKTNSKNRKPFTVTADAPGVNGEATNDEFIWNITYNGGIGLSLDEAVSEGLITYVANTDRIIDITPQQQGTYTVSCIATTNITQPKSDDPSDTIIIEILGTATNISVKDEDTAKNAATTIYLPIGAKKEITVKTSTADNNKFIDPPTYTINSGGEYINVSERVSADGEGITYTIEGLTYGFGVSKITFSSKSSSKTYAINFYVRNNINNAEVKGVDESVEYTGSNLTFSNLELYYGGSSIDNTLYSVAYKDNREVGTATITITGKDIYSGSIKIITFAITPKPFDSTLTIDDMADQRLSSTVRVVEPLPKVRFNGKVLKRDVDYLVSYKNNTSAGTGTVVVTGIGNYSGKATATFKVLDTAEKFTVSSIAKKTYNGKELKPSPTVKYNGKTLKKNVDYTLSYSSNINPGIATVKITGIGNYYGTISKTFIIKPKKNKIKSLKKGVKQFTVEWTAHPAVSGYQVQYALKSNFKKGKKTLNISSYYSSTTVSSLKKKKYYYVRVRSYVTVNGQTIFGAWSKVKKVKTK